VRRFSQGYADLQLCDSRNGRKNRKGTYYADKGDFATAGYVTFQTKEN
jgi:hypothetical protein